MKRTIKNQKNKKSKKSLKCSPYVKGKTPVKNSCLTNRVLFQLKTEFNKNHDNKITTNSPTQIWIDLRERMNTCSKEDCWLNVIEDVTTRKKIIKKLFAPKHPKEWFKNPKTWLSNFDIFEVLKQYEDVYPNFKIIGPTPIDFDSRPNDMNGECVWRDLCTFSLDKYLSEGVTKLGIVFNLDRHDEGGYNWVSLFVDLEDDFVFYFDSAGDDIQREIKALVDRIIDQSTKLTPQKNIQFHKNFPVVHQNGNTECGMYSLHFIITMLTNESGGRKFKNYQEKINFFKTQKIPDNYVFKYRKIYFND